MRRNAAKHTRGDHALHQAAIAGIHVGLAGIRDCSGFLVGSLAKAYPNSLPQQTFGVRLCAVEIGLQHGSDVAWVRGVHSFNCVRPISSTRRSCCSTRPPRTSTSRPRRRHRGDGRGRGGAHHDPHRAPAPDCSARRPDPRGRRRPSGRGRHARRAGRARTALYARHVGAAERSARRGHRAAAPAAARRPSPRCSRDEPGRRGGATACCTRSIPRSYLRHQRRRRRRPARHHEQARPSRSGSASTASG